MSLTQAAYFCLLLAFLMSNLPFFSGGRAVRSKATALRFASWLVLYGSWIAATTVLEQNVSTPIAKDWSFWPVSLAFFAVLAFPGVIYRYLWRP